MSSWNACPCLDGKDPESFYTAPMGFHRIVRQNTEDGSLSVPVEVKLYASFPLTMLLQALRRDHPIDTFVLCDHDGPMDI